MEKLTAILLSIILTVVFCPAQQAPNANQQSNKATLSESPAPQGQQPGSPGKQQPAAAQTSNSPQQQTISGCLNQSGTAYTLTDSQTGTVYQLSGNTRDLSSHLGHEMQITGQPKNTASQNATGAPSASSAKPYLFEVSTTKHLGDQCGPAGATANGPSL